MVHGSSVLVIGGGGREHAICWKIAQSEFVENVYVTPGNPGMDLENKVRLVHIDLRSNKKVVEWCEENNVDIVVIGPEDYLAQGLSDDLKQNNILCFGPSQNAARIESDKEWSKSFMDRNNIPTAKWKAFTKAEEAKIFVSEVPFNAWVVKASGLAAGKGVIVAESDSGAHKAIDEMLVHKKFGHAGETVIVEELLEGDEISILAFTDGKTIVSMAPAQDHKRIFDNDKGPNTGGMGAYCPCSLLSSEAYEKIKSDVLQKAIDGLQKEKTPFVGVLYAGLMITADGPRVLEFNCRFGDPETEVILPLLKSDLYILMRSCCEGTLKDQDVCWRDNIFATGVVLASKGYPLSSSHGQVINGVDVINSKPDHFIFHCGTKLSPTGETLTNGGRVLIVVAIASSLAVAAGKATSAARSITFEGKQMRTDVAHKGIASSILRSGKMTYTRSGVNIEAGNSLISSIKPAVTGTKRLGSIGTIGGFGGLFDTAAAGYKDPLLVSGTDGVGTKLKIAIQCNKHDSIGIDLVAMCANDVLAHGAEPLFFLDYFACGRLNNDTATFVINGIVEGCKRAGCALVGGETAEMPDMYSHGDYDLAGFCVGAVEREDLLPRTNEIRVGDVIIGLPSSGIHSNGFSLVRKVLKLTGQSLDSVSPFSECKKTIGEELLEPTKIYCVIPTLKSKLVKAFAHITGGGLTENIPRVLPEDLGVLLDASAWNVLPVFGWLAMMGEISKDEMLRTFNCGIGAIIICSPDDKNVVMRSLSRENAVVIGHVIDAKDSTQRVTVRNFKKAIGGEMKKYIASLMQSLSRPLKKVGVLISGNGTNLQALIDATEDSEDYIGYEIVLVISNKPNVAGLKRAEKAGIATSVIQHSDYQDRLTFDEEVNKQLRRAEVEIVCLAGFMRILSKEFVKKWRGALINIHPSLLPSFKGARAHHDVLKSKVRISGCTVHFVEEDVDSGAIIEQQSVPVFSDDTIESLQERVKTVEHKAFPIALKHLATGRIFLKHDNTIHWKY